MTHDDDMREIEAALDELQDAAQDAVRSGCSTSQSEARTKLLALIRAKLPPADAEHEAKVEAWHRDATAFPDHDEPHEFCHVQRCVIEDGVRLMLARPAATERDTAAGELLRVAKEKIRREADNADKSADTYAGFAVAAGLHRAADIIEAAERAGVTP